jgi:hypothetical protein
LAGLVMRHKKVLFCWALIVIAENKIAIEKNIFFIIRLV